MDGPCWRTWRGSEVLPERSAVLRLLGLPPGARGADPQVDEPLVEAVALFARLAEPRGGWLEVEPAGASQELFAASPVCRLAPRLAQAPRAALFLATVGEEPERHASELVAGGRYLLGTMLDAVASEAAERVVDLVQLDAASRLGAREAVRFSPGYAGWSLEAQRPLLARMEADRHGVRLTESWLMLPKKSVSGVIVPRRPDDPATTCEGCDAAGCPGRA